MKILPAPIISWSLNLILLICVALLLWIRVKKPRMDVTVLVIKATCHVIIGFFTPMTSGLAQWANSGEMPGVIVWVITAAFCIVGAASALLSFLSGSYSDFVKGRANGSGEPGDSTATLASKAAAKSSFYANLPPPEKPPTVQPETPPKS